MASKSPNFMTNLSIIAAILTLIFSILFTRSTAIAAQSQVVAAKWNTVGLTNDVTVQAVRNNSSATLGVNAYRDLRSQINDKVYASSTVHSGNYSIFLANATPSSMRAMPWIPLLLLDNYSGEGEWDY